MKNLLIVQTVIGLFIAACQSKPVDEEYENWHVVGYGCSIRNKRINANKEQHSVMRLYNQGKLREREMIHMGAGVYYAQTIRGIKNLIVASGPYQCYSSLPYDFLTPSVNENCYQLLVGLADHHALMTDSLSAEILEQINRIDLERARYE